MKTVDGAEIKHEAKHYVIKMEGGAEIEHEACNEDSGRS